MDWLRKFMYGRNGGDQLSISLVVLSMAVTLIARISDISILLTISYVPLLMALYRMLSKDIQRRRLENRRFLLIFNPIYAKFKQNLRRIKEFRTHRYYKCAKCNTMLRVPKGKGKISITCPKCKEKFIKTT